MPFSPCQKKRSVAGVQIVLFSRKVFVFLSLAPSG